MKWIQRNINDITAPYSLDWGKVTVDLDKDSESVYVFNSNLTDKKTNDYTKALIIGKYNYYKMHIPQGRVQKFIMDIRGQNISETDQRKFENELIEELRKTDLNSKIELNFKI